MEKQLYCYKCMSPISSVDDACSCGFVSSSYSAEPHQLQAGSMLRDRYYIGKVLGEGGFGITYVGCDTVLNLKVAIKEFYMSGYVNRNNTISASVAASQGNAEELFAKNRQKFLGEARVLAKFANELGIVGIRDFFEENNTAYIVMDFLEGETLREYLKKTRKMPWRDTIQTITPILNSLKHVHDENIIHRDISPDNIMITSDGKVKLLDFGAAREVSESDVKSLSVILKPGYAPEEQYRSKGKQGPWTDIYALCATMYVCITGTLPEESMDRLFEDTLKAPSELEPSCDPALDAVILKGMAVRSADRYQNIEDLQKALDAVLNGEAPVVAPAQDFLDNNRTVFAEEMDENTPFIPTPTPAPAKPVEVERKAVVKEETKADPVATPPVKDEVKAPVKEKKAHNVKLKQKDSAKKLDDVKSDKKAASANNFFSKKLFGKIPMPAVIGVAVLLILIILIGSTGKKNKVPEFPKTMEILSDVTANNVLKEQIISFEVDNTSLNDRGDTYTVECIATTSSGEHYMTVYYDRSASSFFWSYSQTIVQ